MKKLFLLLITTLLVFQINAQESEVLKMKAKAVAVRTTTDSGEWGDWGDWIPTDILVVFKNERMVVFSKETQEYDIIKKYDTEINQDGWKIMKSKSVDNEGIVCITEVWIRDSSTQFYVRFNDVAWVYSLKSVQ